MRCLLGGEKQEPYPIYSLSVPTTRPGNFTIKRNSRGGSQAKTHTSSVLVNYVIQASDCKTP